MFCFLLGSPTKEKYVTKKKRHKINDGELFTEMLSLLNDGELFTEMLSAESVEHTFINSPSNVAAELIFNLS